MFNFLIGLTAGFLLTVLIQIFVIIYFSGDDEKKEA